MTLVEERQAAPEKVIPSSNQSAVPARQTPNLNQIGQNLSALRERIFECMQQCGLSQTNIAEEAGVSKSGLCVMLAGDTFGTINFRSLVKISKALRRLGAVYTPPGKIGTSPDLFENPLKIEEDLVTLRAAIIGSMKEEKLTRIRLARALMVGYTQVYNLLTEKGFASIGMLTLRGLLGALQELGVDLKEKHFIVPSCQESKDASSLSVLAERARQFKIQLGKPKEEADIKAFNNMQRVLAEKPDTKGLKAFYCEFMGICTFSRNLRLSSLAAKWLMQRDFGGPAPKIEELVEMALGQGEQLYGDDLKRVTIYALSCFNVAPAERGFSACFGPVLDYAKKLEEKRSLSFFKPRAAQG